MHPLNKICKAFGMTHISGVAQIKEKGSRKEKKKRKKGVKS